MMAHHFSHYYSRRCRRMVMELPCVIGPSVSPGSGQQGRYPSRYGAGPVKSTPALSTFFDFAMRISPPAIVVAEVTMAHQTATWRTLSARDDLVACVPPETVCRGLLPGAGLAPPLPPLPHSISQGSLQTGKPGARRWNGLAMPLYRCAQRG